MAELNQDFDLFRGDTKDLEVTTKDQDGNPLDLTGSTIVWRLFKSMTTPDILKKEIGSGIEVTDMTGGVFIVHLTSDDTDELKGKYQHEAVVTDVRGYTATVLTGFANIFESKK